MEGRVLPGRQKAQTWLPERGRPGRSPHDPSRRPAPARPWSGPREGLIEELAQGLDILNVPMNHAVPDVSRWMEILQGCRHPISQGLAPQPAGLGVLDPAFDLSYHAVQMALTHREFRARLSDCRQHFVAIERFQTPVPFHHQRPLLPRLLKGCEPPAAPGTRTAAPDVVVAPSRS
jgi:hypothetical protein